MGKYLNLAQKNANDELTRKENEVIKYKEPFLESLAESFTHCGQRRFDRGSLVLVKMPDGQKQTFRPDIRILSKWAEEEGFKVSASCWYCWHEGEPDLIEISLPTNK